MAFVCSEIQELPWIALNLACFSSIIKLKPIFAPASVINSIPILSVKANRFLTLSSGPVEDRIRRSTTTSIVICIVSLILITFVYASLIIKVINLPSFTSAID